MEGLDLGSAAAGAAGDRQKSPGSKTGARGLRSILEQVLLDLMFDLPMEGVSKSCDENTIIGEASPFSSIPNAEVAARLERRLSSRTGAQLERGASPQCSG